MIEPWHVLVAAAAIIFVGWCILRNRPIKTDTQLEVEAEEKRQAELFKKFIDTDLNEKVVMRKKK